MVKSRKVKSKTLNKRIKMNIKNKLVVLLISFSLTVKLIGQNRSFNFNEIKVIALDTFYYMKPDYHELNSYKALIEILDKKYDTITFCRKRIVVVYLARFCDLKEGETYKVKIDKIDFGRDYDNKLLENYKRMLNQSDTSIVLCYDPIFHLNDRFRYMMFKIAN